MTNYIGFPDSDKFLDAVDRERPINMFVGQETVARGKRFGITREATFVSLSQVQDGEILYFHDIVHQWQAVNGSVMDRDESRPARLAAQVLAIVKLELDERDIKYREAMLAMPRKYTLLEGSTIFLRFNKDEDSFERIKFERIKEDAIMSENEQHVYHHSDSDGPRVNVKVEKNTKGFNYEATVTGAKTVDEALALLTEAQARLQGQYGAAQPE